ncbi:hypothetical protein EXIGLDRAFT_841049 [Exidia glandulosa HHB12029]|uniref:F-box domain-containing protein n=1 Tax=Exidia glandulosa HHB12029 TaxID=1314781 RepID=A0A165E415_EXIGL|nr:hypothetical protein EXIGLDRAFT_841049 [Exidia glandulosa HHB12029]
MEEVASLASQGRFSDLPEDLLVKVFQHLAGESATRGRPMLSIVVVAQVSRAWRTAALGTPRAWSHIDLNFSDVSAVPLRSRAYLDALLERSKAAPLHIRLYNYCPKHDPGRPGGNQASHYFRSYDWGACERAFHALLRHAHRWKTFALSCEASSHEARRALLRRFHVPMPQLQEFALHLQNSDGFHTRGATAKDTPLLPSAPSVHTVDIDQGFLRYVVFPRSIQLSSLTLGGYRSKFVGDISAILAACPNLQRLRLDNKHSSFGGVLSFRDVPSVDTMNSRRIDTRNSRRIELPALTDIQVLNGAFDALVALNCELVLHSLRSITVRPILWHGDTSAFLTTVCLQLRYLNVQLAHRRQQTLSISDIVMQFPYIEELIAENWTVEATDFGELAQRDVGRNLTRLSLPGCVFSPPGNEGAVAAAVLRLVRYKMNQQGRETAPFILDLPHHATIPERLHTELEHLRGVTNDTQWDI